MSDQESVGKQVENPDETPQKKEEKTTKKTKKKSLAEYIEGDEFLGETITKLFSSKAEVLIYEANNCAEITIYTDDIPIRKLCSQISPKMAIINSFLKTKPQKERYIDQIGMAYAEVIEGNVKGAIGICDQVILRIEKNKKDLGKFKYLVSCLAVVFINVILCWIMDLEDLFTDFYDRYLIMTYASIGGFLSIAKNLNKIEVDSYDFGWFQVFYGALRIFLSMLSGLIMYILIKSELLFPKLLDGSETSEVFHILAILAGFSESLIPDLLKRIETNKLNSKGNAKAPKGGKGEENEQDDKTETKTDQKDEAHE
jgi:hypothetical protein